MELRIYYILAITDPKALRLIGTIVLVFALNSILKKIEGLKGIVDSLQKLGNDYRFILAFIPSFLSLLPMPAGAIFSAPIVNEVSNKVNLTAEKKFCVNYWFRHILGFI